MLAGPDLCGRGLRPSPVWLRGFGSCHVLLWQSDGGTEAKQGLALPVLTSVFVPEGIIVEVMPAEPLKDVGSFNALFLFYIFNDFCSLFFCFGGFTSECPNKGERPADWWKMWSAAKTEGRTEPTQSRLDQMSLLYSRQFQVQSLVLALPGRVLIFLDFSSIFNLLGFSKWFIVH